MNLFFKHLGTNWNISLIPGETLKCVTMNNCFTRLHVRQRATQHGRCEALVFVRLILRKETKMEITCFIFVFIVLKFPHDIPERKR